MIADDVTQERLFAFLHLLGATSDGDVVCRAVALGLLAGHDAEVVGLFAAHPADNSLRAVGAFGVTPAMVRTFQEIPLGLRLPHVECFASGARMVVSSADLHDRYPLAAPSVRDSGAPHFWLHLMPLRLDAVPIGVLTLRHVRTEPPTETERAIVEGVAPALSLWLTARNPRVASVARGTLDFSDRSRRVLDLAAQGWTNQAIARELGFAEVTIKADLTAPYRALGATGRDDLIARARDAGLLDSVADGDDNAEADDDRGDA